MEENKAIEANDSTIASGEEVKVLPSTEIDLEARNTALEAEKARLVEEKENYKLAYLKEKSKKSDPIEDEDEEDRLRRITREELANSRIVEIAREQDEIIKKALKENKELKLAQLNKSTSTPPAGMGNHNESIPVRDTLVTPEQLAYFKAPKPNGLGWTDKEIADYKKKLTKYGGR